MDKLAVYARSNHPSGYGTGGGTAHGYVILAVICPTEDVVKDVSAKVQQNWEWPGRNDDWYSGAFDLIFMVDHNTEAIISAFGSNITPNQAEKAPSGGDAPFGAAYISYGDNRALAVETADKVLEQKCPHRHIHLHPDGGFVWCQQCSQRWKAA